MQTLLVLGILVVIAVVVGPLRDRIFPRSVPNRPSWLARALGPMGYGDRPDSVESRVVNAAAEQIVKLIVPGWSVGELSMEPGWVWIRMPRAQAAVLTGSAGQMQAFQAALRAKIDESVMRSYGRGSKTPPKITHTYNIVGVEPGPDVEVKVSTTSRANPWEIAVDQPTAGIPIYHDPSRVSTVPFRVLTAAPLDHASSVEFKLSAPGEKDKTWYFPVGVRISVGRHPEAEVRLPELAGLSADHASVLVTQDESGLKATIEDHSTYGSYISGSKVGRGLRRMIELPGIVHLDQSGLVRLKIAVPAFNSGEAEVKR